MGVLEEVKAVADHQAVLLEEAVNIQDRAIRGMSLSGRQGRVFMLKRPVNFREQSTPGQKI
ncbi:MAG: hypothetical protein LBJ70_03160 [Holosporales bacterium]|jgi:hypothetical protein|nr:hypothetical protein [Holosporales bacterium]